MVVVAADADTVGPAAVLDIVGIHVLDMALAYKLVLDRCLAQHFHLVEQARNSGSPEPDPTTHMSEARPVDTYMVGTLWLMVV